MLIKDYLMNRPIDKLITDGLINERRKVRLPIHGVNAVNSAKLSRWLQREDGVRLNRGRKSGTGQRLRVEIGMSD